MHRKRDWRKASIQSIAIVGVILMLAMLANTTHAQTNTIVRCEPVTPLSFPAVAPVGQPIVWDVYIENIDPRPSGPGLMAFDLDITFDETIARIDDITPSTSWFSADVVFFNDIDNTNGLAHLVYGQLNPTPPVEGSGPVARVTMEGLIPGIFTVDFPPCGDPVLTRPQLSGPGGEPIARTCSGCMIEFQDPNAATISNFQAQLEADNSVLISWLSELEIDVAGFNVLRGNSADVDAAIQINSGFVRPQSDQENGQLYQYLDPAPGTGEWFYWLQEVDIHGNKRTIGPASVTVSVPTTVQTTGFNATSTSVAHPLILLCTVILALIVFKLIISRPQRD